MAALHPLGLTLACALPAYFALALAARAASATPQCTFRTQPAVLDASWVEAAERARSVLSAKSGDCSNVLLEVDDGRARLIYTTLDGRQATRWLENPDALEPALTALAVTLSTNEETTRNEPSGAAAPPAAPAKRASDGGNPSPPPSHLLVEAQAGVRLAGSEPMLAPTLAAGAAMTVGDFELGVGAQWEPAYLQLGESESPGSSLSSLGANIAIGRRNPVGKSCAIVTGARVSAAIMHQQWRLSDSTAQGETEHEGERAQARVGAYAGPIVPMSKATRFRALLEADIDPMHVGATRHGENAAPPLPWWAVSLALGVESELL